MFRWYSAAGVCYAYLSDVHLDGHSGPDDALSSVEARAERTPIHSAAYVSFEKSRWFTRGWTLQELIAPQRLLFFDAYWTPIGTKATLAEAVARSTKIDRDVLTGRSFMSVNVATRMSWAASRETSRVEDRAYALLGIFDVNMPLIYGEGTKAFRRLQEEIIRTTADQSIFCWQNLPPDENEVDANYSFGALLAPSPDQFLVDNSGRRRIRLWEDSPLAGKHSLGNMGLEIHLPLIEEPESDEFWAKQFLWGVLSCRYENDFDGLIALLLNPAARLRDTQGTRVLTIRDSRFRTIRVPLQQALKAPFEHCIIRWDSAKAPSNPPLSSAFTDKFWLRATFPSDLSYVALRKGPSLAWVEEDVLAPRELGTQDAFVIWHYRSSARDMNYHIGLAVRTRRSVIGCERSPRFAFFQPEPDDTFFGWVSDDTDKQLLAASKALDLAGARKISAPLFAHLDFQVSTNWQVIMGENVVTIDLNCSDRPAATEVSG